jgi:hypothetical protein
MPGKLRPAGPVAGGRRRGAGGLAAGPARRPRPALPAPLPGPAPRGGPEGEATGAQLAYLTDRLRVADKRKQVYGTQLVVVGGKFEPAPIEDEASVDRRRREAGLPPLAEYLRGFEQALTGRHKGGW